MDEIQATTPLPVAAHEPALSENKPASHPRPCLVDTDSPFKKLERGKHARYLSDYADDVICIDVGQAKPLVIDLGAIMLPANAPAGRRQAPFPLIQLPHWANAIKACINEWLHLIDANDVYALINRRFAHLIHFIEFCVLNVRYSFAAATPKDIEQLINGLRNAGWYSALNMQAAFERLVQECAKNKALLDECIAWSSSSKRIQLKYEVLSKYLGLHVSKKNVPPFVYQELSKLAGHSLPDDFKPNDPGRQKTAQYYMSMFPVLNTLFHLPAGFDRLGFCPFPSPQETAAKIGVALGRTENLSLDDATRILKISLDCIYNWSRSVIEMGCELRKKMEDCLAEGLNEKATSKRMNAHLLSIYPGYKEKYGLPFERLSCVAAKSRHDEDNAPAFNDLVHLILTSCMVMTGMNHGRRKNEIIGGGFLPYGLYFGCVKVVNDELQQYRLDIYVEKTVLDWTEFWCNKLVKDAVSVLEQLHQLFRPLGSPEVKGTYQSRDLDHKLFTYRLLCQSGFEATPCAFRMERHSRLFFELANVERKVLEQKTHVFRRFFALIYYYRYDNRTLQALSHHLRHLNQETTRVYIEDPVSRKEADQIQTLYLRSLQENAEQDAIDVEVRSEKFLDSIKYIIAGNPTSGGFARHVLRVYSYCARNVDFRTLDEEQQAIHIRDRFEGKGYTPNPMRHGECEAGSSRSKARGKCYDADDGRLHRENARAELCSKCMFHFSDPIYLANLETDLPNLAERAENRDGDYDLAEQAAAAEEYDNLFALLEGLREEQQRFAEKAQTLRAAVAAEKEVDHAGQ